MKFSYRRKNKEYNRANSIFKNRLKRRKKLYINSKKIAKLKSSEHDSCVRLFNSRVDYIFSKFLPFIEKDYLDETNIISFPEIFSLQENYKESLIAIKKFITNYIYIRSDIHLDFSKCTKADVSAIFILQILKKEIELLYLSFQNKTFNINLLSKVFWNRSGSKEVNRIMISCGFPKLDSMEQISQDDTKFYPQSSLGYFKGSSKQKQFLENKKGVCSKAVVDYVNNCLNEYNYELTSSYKSNFNGIIGEVLSNCEDHSTFNTWFVHANYSQMNNSEKSNEKIGELNLTILNFGESIYEAFIQKKSKNSNLYQGMVKRYEAISKKYNIGTLGLEQFIVLYLMSEGLSRFIYQDTSRGTGTIKFLNSFINLGDYSNNELNIKPKLSIYSGNTELICDHLRKPFKDKDQVFLLTLNNENDLDFAPDLNYLKNNEYCFPGTLISIRIYLNEKQLDEKLKNAKNENN